MVFHSPSRQPQAPRHQDTELDIKSMKQRLDALVKQAEAILPPEKKTDIRNLSSNRFFPHNRAESGGL